MRISANQWLRFAVDIVIPQIKGAIANADSEVASFVWIRRKCSGDEYAEKRVLVGHFEQELVQTLTADVMGTILATPTTPDDPFLGPWAFASEPPMECSHALACHVAHPDLRRQRLYVAPVHVAADGAHYYMDFAPVQQSTDSYYMRYLREIGVV